MLVMTGGGPSTTWLSMRVSNPPSLVTSPSSVEVDEGSEATFSVAVDGSGPFKYEWFYNGESIGVYDSAESVIPW